METANGAGYSHDDDTGRNNAFCCERPFGMRVSKKTDVMATVHTGRDGQGVTLSQNVEASVTAQLVDRRREGNESTR